MSRNDVSRDDVSTEQPPRRRSRAVAWAVLAVAGLLEIAWSLALKEADGLTRPGWTTLGIATAVLSLALLTHALKNLPVGTAYAAWVGIGTLGVATAGMLAFDEPVTVLRLLFLGLIVGGVIALSLTDASPEPPARPGSADPPAPPAAVSAASAVPAAPSDAPSGAAGPSSASKATTKRPSTTPALDET